MGNGEVAGGGRERGWCVVAMETLSPSLIIIWGKMARGLLPRVTPPFPPFAPSLSLYLSLPTPVSLPLTLPIAVAAPLLLRFLPPCLLPRASPRFFFYRLLVLFSTDCFFYTFYFSSGFTSPSHRTAAPTLPASGILCLHLTGATV